MYVVVVNFKVKSEHAVEFLEAVMSQAKNSLALEDQCHEFDVCTATTDADSVLLYEHYATRDAFDAHLESDHFRAFDEQVSPWIASKTVSTWHLRRPGA